MVRHRENDARALVCGSYTSPIGPTTFLRCSTDGFRRTSDDTIGAYPLPTDLSLMESNQYYPKLTCTGNNRTWLEAAVGYQPAVPDPRTFYPALTALDRNNWAWKILAESNPSVPHISVPTIVGELKDLPGLVSGFWRPFLRGGPVKYSDKLDWVIREGGAIRRGASDVYLNWRWAIRPMMSDLQKLLRFTKSVDDRTTMLMKLRAGETLRRRVSLGTSRDTANPQNNFIVHSEGCTVRGNFLTHYYQKSWGSAQWKLLPDSVLPTLGYGPLREQARNLTFGFKDREALAVAWELTPWSWLADWFGNTGDLIAATNNSVGCTWHNVCFMRTSSATTSCTMLPQSSDGFAIAGLKNRNYVLTMTRKERYVCVPVLPVPFPMLPILTNGQWSILAALAAQRR